MGIHSWRTSGRKATSPRLSTQARGSRLVTLLSSVFMLVGVAGCGDQPTTDADSRRESSDKRSSTPSQPSTASSAADPDSAALGIAGVTWPDDRAGVAALLDQMPKRLAGRPMTSGPVDDGFYANVGYGPVNKGGIVVAVISPDSEMKDPKANLSVTFGMGSSCRRDSYAGTAPFLAGSSSRWGVPGWETTDASIPGSLWWFTCSSTTGEVESFPGHAIGWVSGDLAWLVTTPDRATTKATLEAMAATRAAR